MPNAIPHNALIVVADGGKAILFRNDDSSGGLSLREERRLTPKNLQDEGPSASRPGEQSPSQTDEATFAKQLGKAVNQMKLDGDFNKLVLIADSQTLGQFREVMHKTVEAGLVLTLAKDLTNHSPRQITDVILTGSHCPRSCGGVALASLKLVGDSDEDQEHDHGRPGLPRRSPRQCFGGRDSC